jgi:hypothetical protein
LEAIDTQRWDDITRLVGLTDAGDPIRIVLEAEDSDLGHRVPSWIAGFAAQPSETVVIFPRRSPTYPDDTLEDVLRHEVAHILIGRAAAGRPIPRWFDEGFAMEVERERRFRDQTELLYQLVTGNRANLGELSRLFNGGQNDQSRAYAIAGAMAHDLRSRFGDMIAARILARVRGGASFDDAFLSETRITPEDFDMEFWNRQRAWTTWVPIVTSTGILWPAITLLALLAIYIRRRRNREIEKRWEDEGDGL